MSAQDFTLGLPIVFATLWSVVLIVVEAALHRRIVTKWVTIVGFASVLGLCVSTPQEPGFVFYEMLRVGLFSHVVMALFALSGLLVVMLSDEYLVRRGVIAGEYYIILFIAVYGMMLMGASASMLVIFIGLETMSLSLYVLTGMMRRDKRSNEAAMKYFLLGSFASAIFLYGISLMYGATGELCMHKMLESLIQAGLNENTMILFWCGFLLLMVGFLFKVSAVPFHQWTPDVYDGAPTSVTAFMSTGAKSAAFAAMISVITSIAPILNAESGWTISMAMISAFTMIIGNLTALAQKSIKRMLAYSSIAHAGYLLMGLAVGTTDALSGVLFYLFIYTLMNIGAFGIVSFIEENEGEVSHSDFTGFSKTHPFYAAVMAVFMLSLAGIPPLAGFVGKYLVFSAAIDSGLLWLAVIGVLTSAISAYYYLRVIVAMYMSPSEAQHTQFREIAPNSVVILMGACVIILGILPSFFITLSENALKMAFIFR